MKDATTHNMSLSPPFLYDVRVSTNKMVTRRTICGEEPLIMTLFDSAKL